MDNVSSPEQAMHSDRSESIQSEFLSNMAALGLFYFAQFSSYIIHKLNASHIQSYVRKGEEYGYGTD